ncbi:threonine ammonia-lyase IlvA [Amycolatopsis sp. FDAARGOS 1241]|uniref:threonine ammonia-lyase IlvA n=1 Tax=Amycolatopsis sp. FDAARGOS 1241 TaxID=2778070 RepID=UPI00195239A5|nr:threonine ammonia-lyase IlvA [Amycolatopsis sp. FDAARGOS 1241]QRP44575.1 threonine ammonia-lyase IlvA [Amycolatopsis sp. FDAARGOS 1241]
MHDIDTVNADLVEQAAERLAGVISRTPLEPNARLSAKVDARVWLKREDQQTVRSYKIRGAYNFIVQLDEPTRARGVVCASAGNHAQGVAYACRRLGANGRVYVPGTTPRQKRERIATLGGAHIEVIVVGETYEDAFAAANEDAQRTGATLVPAFDDPRTVAGQGTVALEVVEQLGFVPDVLVVPVGGGGLLAGIATWVRERHPDVRVVGVEPEGAMCMAAAVKAGEPVQIDSVDPFVDGAAVREAGAVTYPLVRDSGAELTSVAEGAVCTEMLAMYQSDGIIAEPAGALAAAALGTTALVEPGQTVVCIVSGGNNDVSRYSEILERSLIHEGLRHYFLVNFPQEPGALRRFLDEILGPEDDVTRFEYVKRNNRELGPALIGIEITRPAELPGLLARLAASPLQVERVEAGSPLFHFLL